VLAPNTAETDRHSSAPSSALSFLIFAVLIPSEMKTFFSTPVAVS
jgi:hypothetical protein